MACSPPGSSVHGIFWARILEWVAISYSRGINPEIEPASLALQADSLLSEPSGKSYIYPSASPFLLRSGWGTLLYPPAQYPPNPLTCRLKCSVSLTWSISCPPLAWKIRKDRARVTLSVAEFPESSLVSAPWERLFSDYYFYFLLEYNCFTVSCWFLLYSIMNELYVGLYPLPVKPLSHPHPLLTPLRHHRAPSWVPYAIQ